MVLLFNIMWLKEISLFYTLSNLHPTPYESGWRSQFSDQKLPYGGGVYIS